MKKMHHYQKNYDGDKINIRQMIIKRKILLFSLLFLLVALPIFFLVTKYQSKVEAAWMNDNWLYRTGLTIGNTGSSDTNKKVKFDIDTAALIAAGKMQTDCGDSRFTDMRGRALKYFIDTTGGACNTNSTDYYVLVPVINTGNTVLYYYYGNPSVQNGTVSSQFSEGTFSPTSGPTGASEENGAAPVAYWKFDDGYGTNAKDSTQNAKNGTLSGVPEWKPESECISGKCLFFDGTNSDNVSVNDSGTTDPLDLGTKSFTVSYWGRPIDYTYPKSLFPILDGSAPYTSGAGHEGWSIGDGYVTTGTGIVINDGTNMVSTTLTFNVGSRPPDLINKWTHFTFVFDRTSTNNVYAYINGALQTTTVDISSVTGSISNTTALNIGYGTGWKTHGYIDDIKIYPYARTAAQIKSDFASKGSGSVKGLSAQMGTNAKNSNALSDGLFNYWKMDEATWSGTVNEVIDSSGNGKHGVAGGAAGGKAYPTVGKFGNAAYFDGVDDYIDNPDYKPNSDNFTLAAWFNLSSADSASSRIHSIFGSNQNAAMLGYTPNSKVFSHFRQYTGGSETVSFSATSSNLADSNWHHVALTVNQQNYKVRLYVDGVFLEEKSVGTEGYTHSNGDFIYMGTSYIPSAITYWKGLIDEVRVYKRTLSAEEVRDLYAWAPGPVGYWNMDEKTGQTVNDISGNGYSGTLGLNSSVNTDDPTWTTGKFGAGLSFDGGDYVAKGTGPTIVNSVSFWTYPTSTTNYFIDLNGSAYISATSGTLSATGFSSPTIYVNGVVSSTIVANQWQYITVTTATNLNASALNFGKISTNYLVGKLDEINLYNYVRNSKQIVEDMNAGHPVGGSPVGSQVGYWKFDEGNGITANNSGSGGSVINGTLTSSPVWSNSGKFGKALSYNGSGSYVDVGNDSSANLTNQLTITAWVNPSVNDSVRTIVARHTGSNGYAFQLRDLVQAGRLTFFANGTTSTGNTVVQTGQWSHVAITYDSASTTVKFYLNGKPDGSNTSSGTILSQTQSLCIGRLRPADTIQAFSGLIDEVKIYNAALTSDEVKLDYNRGSAMVLGTMSDTSGLSGGSIASSSASAEYCIPGDTATCASPVAEWKVDEGTGVTANDTSGNGNTITLGAGTTTPTWFTGKIGKALKFDGSDDRVTFSGVSIGTTHSVSFWIYPIPTSDNYGTLIAQNNTLGLWYRGGTKKITYYYSGDHENTTALTENQWHHVEVITIGGNVTFYIDGKSDGTATGAVAYTANNMGDDVSSETFKGLIDQTRIYNYARTPAQVAWDYNQGKPVGWWKLDECQGTTAFDAAGNGNNGTITIGATGTNTSSGTCTGSAGEAWKDGVTGKYNSSLEFDGTDDYVEVALPSSITYTNPVTVSLWVKSPSTQALKGFLNIQSDQQILTGYYDSSCNGFRISRKATTAYSICPNSSVSQTQWNHLVIVSTGGDTVPTLYVNGILNSATAPSYLSAWGSNIVQLGKGYNDSYNSAGQIDDVRIYNYALTPQQVKMVYNNGSAIQFAPATGTP